ncbi:hypothetical protein [Acinetobacter baumannii]|nr:hypothetical protein [Acinetobacter baumannii]MCZ3135708.1 hypothetical protein [Acinetobacter baumannii]MDC7620071.1 hypothetical protein [Acinetobacter baumannii]MDC7665761.1 hypothetical protein [Acinetobacter baumannii]MDF0611342.1 hypothetical protein [Acinetobacter baumannii]MDF0620281.1 hypothetical protein [Acinetobacter baumannii]
MNTQTHFLNKRIKAVFTVGELIGFALALLIVIALAVAAGFTAAQ